VKTLLTSWDANKEISNKGLFKYLDLYDLRRLMELLAYWIHSQGNSEDNEGGTRLDAVAHGGNPQDRAASLLNKDDLIAQLSKEIKTLKQVQLYQAKQEAEAFVTLIRDRTGLLNEQGQDCYAFVHKTFQEYLCAQEINYQAEDEYDFSIILNHIREHLHDSHWREVLLLLIAQQKPKNAARAIRAVLNNTSNYEQWLHRDLLFAGNCLAEDPKNLRGADGELVQEILEGLIELEVSSEEWVGYKVRAQVFQIICNLYETDFQAQALEMLKEQSDRIDQTRLLKYRAELGEKDQVITICLARLEDSDSEVRWRAARALGELGNSSETVVSTLLAQLQNKNSEVRWRATRALSELGNSSETVLKSLLARLEDRDSELRCSAARVLAYFGNSSEAVVSALLARLQDTDSEVRGWAASALGHLLNSSETVVSALLARLEDTDFEVRGWAANALGRLGNSSETVISALLALLQDHKSFVRGYSAIALGRLGNSSETVVSPLLALLQDTDSEVRRRAARALGKLGNNSEVVINALLALLQDTDFDVRRKTAYVLGKFGKTSNHILPTVIEWIEQHQDCDYVGSGIDALWDLVVGEE
ncbi:MAG: signal transduction protein, partial [Moorea sp. SIO3C2]|nr:signal transduction protein [Moorena sp. SIO3C2]